MDTEATRALLAAIYGPPGVRVDAAPEHDEARRLGHFSAVAAGVNALQAMLTGLLLAFMLLAGEFGAGVMLVGLFGCIPLQTVLALVPLRHHRPMRWAAALLNLGWLLAVFGFSLLILVPYGAGASPGGRAFIACVEVFFVTPPALALAAQWRTRRQWWFRTGAPGA